MDIKRAARLRKFQTVDLYPVISAELSGGKTTLEILKILGNSDVKILQLREKNLLKPDFRDLAYKAKNICDQRGILLIINDHVDIAMEISADGVHLGNDDMDLKEARKKAPSLIIGRSTHNLEEALRAQKEDADYINVGPIFATNTKITVVPVGLEMFKKIKNEVEIPISVMGGINATNIEQVCAAGADKIGMIKGIIYGDIEKNLKQLYAIYNNCFK